MNVFEWTSGGRSVSRSQLDVSVAPAPNPTVRKAIVAAMTTVAASTPARRRRRMRSARFFFRLRCPRMKSSSSRLRGVTRMLLPLSGGYDRAEIGRQRDLDGHLRERLRAADRGVADGIRGELLVRDDEAVVLA